MRIAVSGSVGVGKTTIATLLSKQLDYECVHLNDIAQQFKISDIKDLETFDFDVKKCLEFVESSYDKENIIFESHFAHLLSPSFVDVLIILNRDLKELKKEYVKREYNSRKIEDNLEVESFNVCFYEAEEEGYKEEQFIVVESSSLLDKEDIVCEIVRKLSKKEKFSC